MGPVRAILFDLDGTLLDYEQAAWEATVYAVCADLARTAPALDEHRLYRTYTTSCIAHWRAAEGTVVRSPSGSRDGYAIWKELWQYALADCGHRDARLAERALELYASDRHARYRLYDDVADALAACRSHCSHLALITNGPLRTQRDKLQATGLDGYFDAVVISGEVGVAKPDRAIFDLAVRRLGVAPGSVWYIGDSLARDVAGARHAGLGAAIWLNRYGRVRHTDDPRPHHWIASLRELAALVSSRHAPCGVDMKAGCGDSTTASR